MAITPKSESKSVAVYNCCKCKEHYNSLTQFFKSNSNLYANTGYLPICKKCLLELFNQYIEKYGDTEKAMQRTCMAFDLYYNKSLFDTCDNGTEATLGNYIKRLNMVQYKNKTFETSIEEGFVFGEKEKLLKNDQLKDDDEEDSVIEQRLIDTWGEGLNDIDYKIMENHYKLLKNANPQGDSNQEIFIIDLCYIKMQQMKAVREGKVDDYNKLTDSYRKSFKEAGLKTVRDSNINEEFAIGVNAETIEKYTPAEYYKNKELYRDYDNLGEYIERFLYRPLRNLMHGSKDRDFEFYVKEEGDTDVYTEEE